jgi:hypothetical protein
MKDIPDLLESLKRTPRILAEFVGAVPHAKLDLRRGEGVWTVGEHVRHLAQVQPMLAERCRRFLREERPEFIPYVPGKGTGGPDVPEPTMGAALEGFARSRGEQLALLEKADAVAWRKTALHPEYETYTLYILARHILMHDYWHMYRMEELLLARDAYLTRMD